MAHLPWAHPGGFQSFSEFSTLLLVSTIWGICFSLKANPNGSNEKSFDTVLPRCEGVEQHRRRPVIRYFAFDGVDALGSLAAESASE